MMQKDFCDKCGKEIPREEDIRVIKIFTLENKPVIKPLAVCVWCVEELKETLK